MQILTLRIRSFRAHRDTSADFGPSVNLITGPNGAGKTNILEAIHYLCLGKSFVASKDRYAVRDGSAHFEIEGRFQSSNRKYTARVAYSTSEGKTASLNGGQLDRIVDLVGVFPAVVFSPADQSLTAGGPDERRRFLNNALSQSKPAYLDDILKYRRTLKQRNALLQQIRTGSRSSAQLLDSWTAELAKLGGRVTWTRSVFLERFSTYLEEAARRIESIGEEPQMRYEPLAGVEAGMQEHEISERLSTVLDRKRRFEIERGRTLAGPHLDEVRFFLDGLEVRRYASQGQHRTFGLALKLALYLYLHDQLEEAPILLLDDVFGDLDDRRTRIFTELLMGDSVRQSIITAADSSRFGGWLSFENRSNRFIQVKDGSIDPQSSASEETGSNESGRTTL